jgi:hypothetical protein
VNHLTRQCNLTPKTVTRFTINLANQRQLATQLIAALKPYDSNDR